MKRDIVPFINGFLACYLLASLAFGAAMYASQQITVAQAVVYGPRWPVLIGLLCGRDAWLKYQAALP